MDMHIKDIMYGANGLSNVDSANALKELGASVPDSSFCCMAISAIANPEIRFIMYMVRNKQVVIVIPGPAASSGRTSILAPTVFPVIKQAVQTTGTRKSSRNDDDCSSADNSFIVAIETADTLL